MPELLGSAEKDFKDKRDTVARGPSTLSHDIGAANLKSSIERKREKSFRAELASFANNEARTQFLENRR